MTKSQYEKEEPMHAKTVAYMNSPKKPTKHQGGLRMRDLNLQRLCSIEFAEVGKDDPNEDAIVEPNVHANSPKSQCRSERRAETLPE